ncbi:Os01g0330100, partial [Oryza sativa Japonica Group]
SAFLTLWSAVVVVAAVAPTVAAAGFSCRGGARPVVFNFGDSNSDTGGMAAAMGWRIRRPEGRAFFHHPTGRFCDGRLTIDFLCQLIFTFLPVPPFLLL